MDMESRLGLQSVQTTNTPEEILRETFDLEGVSVEVGPQKNVFKRNMWIIFSFELRVSRYLRQSACAHCTSR